MPTSKPKETQVSTNAHKHTPTRWLYFFLQKLMFERCWPTVSRTSILLFPTLIDFRGLLGICKSGRSTFCVHNATHHSSSIILLVQHLLKVFEQKCPFRVVAIYWFSFCVCVFFCTPKAHTKNLSHLCVFLSRTYCLSRT